jgi:hypothetical protein
MSAMSAMTEHFHNCPLCFDAFPCSYPCTIEPDLADRGRDFGSNIVCQRIECQIRAAADRYHERFEARCAESLRRLRAPGIHLPTVVEMWDPNVGMISERDGDPLCGVSSVGVQMTRAEARVTCPKCRELMKTLPRRDET